MLSKYFLLSAKVPGTLILDISCYDNNGARSKKNFLIPKKLNLTKYFLPDLDVDAKPAQANYEIFAAIACEGQSVESSNYFPLIKKRHKMSKMF